MKKKNKFLVKNFIVDSWNQDLNLNILTNVTSFNLSFCDKDPIRHNYYNILMRYFELVTIRTTKNPDYPYSYGLDVFEILNEYLEPLLKQLKDPKIVAHLLHTELNILDELAEVGTSFELRSHVKAQVGEIEIKDFIKSKMFTLFPGFVNIHYLKEDQISANLEEEIIESLIAIRKQYNSKYYY